MITPVLSHLTHLKNHPSQYVVIIKEVHASMVVLGVKMEYVHIDIPSTVEILSCLATGLPEDVKKEKVAMHSIPKFAETR
jgi:hypothetical protein